MKKIFIILSFIVIGLSGNIRAGEHTFSINFELTDVMMNRAVIKQFNDPSFFYKTITGNVNIPNEGTAVYQINLARPIISFNVDNVIISLNFAFHAEIGAKSFDYTFSGSPTISVPTSTLSSTQIEATLNNFEEVLTDLVTSNIIPQWLKTLIFEKYNTFKPYLTLSPLINLINETDFVKERSLSVTEVSLTTTLQSGKFIIKLNFTVETFNKEFKVNFVDDQWWADKIHFKPNIKCTVDRIIVYNTLGQTQADFKGVNLLCEPNTTTVLSNVGNCFPAQGNYIIEILYRTSSTVYVCRYIDWPDNEADDFIIEDNKFNY